MKAMKVVVTVTMLVAFASVASAAMMSKKTMTTTMPTPIMKPMM